MNKLVIPTILIATVLVAGFFALIPIQDVSTVHTTLLQGRTVEVTASLHDHIEDRDSDGAHDEFSYVVSDTTPLDMRTVHVAVTLEIEGDDGAGGGIAENCIADGTETITLAGATADEIQVLIGSAGGFTNVLDSEAEVEAALVSAAGSPVRDTATANNVMCVLHVDLSPTGTANDVVIVKPTDVGTLQGDETITVTVSSFA